MCVDIYEPEPEPEKAHHVTDITPCVFVSLWLKIALIETLCLVLEQLQIFKAVNIFQTSVAGLYVN